MGFNRNFNGISVYAVNTVWASLKMGTGDYPYINFML